MHKMRWKTQTIKCFEPQINEKNVPESWVHSSWHHDRLFESTCYMCCNAINNRLINFTWITFHEVFVARHGCATKYPRLTYKVSIHQGSWVAYFLFFSFFFFFLFCFVVLICELWVHKNLIFILLRFYLIDKYCSTSFWGL